MRSMVLCGLSNRALLGFLPHLVTDSRETTLDVPRLVGVVDPDEQRVAEFTRRYDNDIVWAAPQHFRELLGRLCPDLVVIASPDGTHADYLTAAVEAGVPTVVEKPFTATAAQARECLDAIKRTGTAVTVAHNLRLTPAHRTLKSLILDGRIGRPVQARLEYHVGAGHGGSYFLRWNRERTNSGGLTVHKSTHHIDLLGWLLGAEVKAVTATGGRFYYGCAGALRTEHPEAEQIAQRYLAIAPNAPRRDPHGLSYPLQYPASTPLSVWDEAIDIEDAYCALLAYEGGIGATYAITFASPIDGYRLTVVGTRGEVSYEVATAGPNPERADTLWDGSKITVRDLVSCASTTVIVPPAEGAHWGADSLLRRMLFGPVDPEVERLGLRASAWDGAVAVAAGEAMARSITSGQSISIADLLHRARP